LVFAFQSILKSRFLNFLGGRLFAFQIRSLDIRMFHQMQRITLKKSQSLPRLVVPLNALKHWIWSIELNFAGGFAAFLQRRPENRTKTPFL